LTKAESAHRKALVERARRLLPELPTAALYRITALLERTLASPDISPHAFQELEKAIRAARPRPKRKDL
jgi:hypothetical protein